jgi:iron-sulfur cluster assembly protein
MSTTTTQTRPKRQLPRAIKLSEAAAARIRDIMAHADGKVQGVRVGVVNGGCAGMNYTMDYAEAPQPFEEVVEDQGVKVFIDPKAIMFLVGTEMDFVREKLGARFVFNNPNQTAACGCGESVTLKPVETN